MPFDRGGGFGQGVRAGFVRAGETLGHAISAFGLTRRFGELVAVDALNLQVNEGEVFGLLGHNGAGKTTTVRLLNGVLAPDAGTVSVLGLQPAVDGPALRARCGVLTETPAIDPRLTGRENLEIAAALFGVAAPDRHAVASALLEEFDLAGRADDRAGNYSKGMRQKLALARTLVHRPELVYLDEPTSGLDPAASHAMHARIRGMAREGRTVLLCTHNLDEAARLCHRLAVLQQGKVIALGTPDALRAQYGGEAKVRLEVGPGDSLPKLAAAISRVAPKAEVASIEGAFRVSGLVRERIPDALASLLEAGVKVYAVTPETPTLEEVYLALTGKAVAAEAPARDEESS